MDELRLIAPYNTNTGYSKMARAALRTALVAGYRVELVCAEFATKVIGLADMSRRIVREPIPMEPNLPDCQVAEINQALATKVSPDAPTLMLLLPFNLCTWPEYGNSPMIGWTMTEADGICDFWKHGMRCTDLVLGPSNFVVDTFRKSAPNVDVALLPAPVDDRLWHVDEYKETIRGAPPFLFYSVFTTCQRKNWRKLMMAFAREFKDESDKVGLIVKPSNSWEPQILATWCREMGAWVKVDAEKRTDWAMGAMYRTCDVYVQPSSEGFGLTYVEAALCGTPSIALDKSGSADVVDEETGYLCPSRMEPILGHMPQWYDECNFATCTVDDLRRTLRRAYLEETAGANKGAAARKRAMERWTPEALAPALRMMIGKGIGHHQQNIYEREFPVSPKWATVAGAWGDVFCCLGTVRAMMQTKEIERIGIIYYGKDEKIAAWLKVQPWVREVIAVIEPDVDEMTRVFGYLCQCKSRHGRKMWEEILGKRGVRITGDIAYTQLCLAEPREPEYWTGAVLPDASNEWADGIAAKIGGDFLLLNPLSIASNKIEDHWHAWNHAIDWLTKNVTCKLALVGEQYIPWPEHERIINLSGQSKTMCDVLALAERSKGVITTSNNLAHYTTIAQIPAVVICARTCSPDTFYHRWNRHPLIALIDHETHFKEFPKAMEARFPQWLKAKTEGMVAA